MMSLTGQIPALPAAPASDPLSVRGVYTSHFPPGSQSTWKRHVHDVHELLWGARGVLTVETDGGYFAVPAMLGLWIPAGVGHAVQSASGTGFYCTHIDATVSGPLGQRTTAVTVAPAVRELLLHMGRFDMPPPVRARSQRLAIELLDVADTQPMLLPMPTDERLLVVARALLEQPALDRSLEDWGAELAISVRNLSRLFHKETGMTFAQWRISARIRVALGLLASGVPVNTVSRRVGYQNPSAFVQTFRRVMGHTPGWYMTAVKAETDNSLAGSA